MKLSSPSERANQAIARPLKPDYGGMETTGFTSRLVAFRQGNSAEIARNLKQVFMVNQVAHTADFRTSQRLEEKTNLADLLIYDHLGIGLLRVDDPEKLRVLSRRLRHSRGFRILRPDSDLGSMFSPSEPIMPIDENGSHQADSVRKPLSGDAVRGRMRTAQTRTKGFDDNKRQSWAIQACGITNARWTGLGAKIAILDTGLDFRHRDWEGREVRHRSFVDDSAQDFHGHGTQCAGLASGLSQDKEVPRFGAAPAAELFVAKVLENDGSGRDSIILAGIDWAIGQGCHVLSLSVGVQSNQPVPDPVYELVGRRCLNSGVLFMAAAGNDSARPNVIRPVSRPASCPSIFAVGAVDRELRPATFTNGSAPLGRGQIDAVAPGVNVFTTSRGTAPYGRFSGTSMAAPLCAGVAALLIQEQADCLGSCLWQRLASVSRRLPHPSTDVGMGLVSLINFRK